MTSLKSESTLRRSKRRRNSGSNELSTKKKSNHGSNCSCDDHEIHDDHGEDYTPASPRGFDGEINKELLQIAKPSQLQTQQQSESGGDQVIFVNEAADMSQIQKEEVQLAVWRQKSPPDFVTQLTDPSIAPVDLPAFEGLVLAEKGVVAPYLKKRLWVPYKLRSHEKRKRALDEKGMDQLVEQIDRLVQVFAKNAIDTGFLEDNEKEGILPFVSVKLKVDDTNGCVFWHQDCVPFRMVTTFRGPCTEWVPPAYSKETLERRKMNSKYSQSLSHCDVALFKGRGETAEGDALLDQPGIVHRSPRIEGSGVCRLVLVIDIPQEGWHF